MSSNQEFWNDLLQANNKCADCNSREGLEWVVSNFGVIVCSKCANIHRNFLDQISIVRSTQDVLSTAEQQYIKDMGNTKANQQLEANVYRTEFSKPAPQAADAIRQEYIVAKYEKTFCNDHYFPELEIDKRNTIPIPNKSLPTPPPKPTKAAPAVPPKSTKPQLSGTSPHNPSGQSNQEDAAPPPVPKKLPPGAVNLMGAPPSRPAPPPKSATSSGLSQSQELPATPAKAPPPTPSNPPPSRTNASSNPVSPRPNQPPPVSPRPTASSNPTPTPLPAKPSESSAPPTSAPPPRPNAPSNGSQAPLVNRPNHAGTLEPPKRAPPKPPSKPQATSEDPVAPEPPQEPPAPAPPREKSPFDKILNDPHNKYCADCGAEAAYGSFGLGIFLCSDCACIHQDLGIPSQQASLVDPDTWDPQVLEFLLIMGNKRANEIWEWDYAEQVSPVKKPTPLSTEAEKEHWIKLKYLERKFADPFYVNKESSDTALQSQSTQFTKEGYLSRLGNGVIPWARKWFVLKDNYLFYYTSKEDLTPLGAIPLLDAQICVSAANTPSAPKNMTLRKLNAMLDSSPQDTDATFEINTPKRLYVLKADTFPEMNDWIVILSQNVDFLRTAPKRSAARNSARSSVLNLNTHILKQGVLFKFGEKNLTYKKRWFILQGHSMYYFKNRTDETPAGKISLRGATVKIVAARFGQKHTFQVYTPDEVFNLSADTSGVMNDWVDAIHDVIQTTFEGTAQEGKEVSVPPEPALSHESSVLEGYLHKTGEIKKGFLDWKKRWFILKGNGSLYYFVNKGDKVPVGSINVLTTKFTEVPASNKKFYFDLQTPHRTYHFYGDAPGDVVAWRNAVGRVQGAITKPS